MPDDKGMGGWVKNVERNKMFKVSVISHGDVMHSIRSIINNIILYGDGWLVTRLLVVIT